MGTLLEIGKSIAVRGGYQPNFQGERKRKRGGKIRSCQTAPGGKNIQNYGRGGSPLPKTGGEAERVPLHSKTIQRKRGAEGSKTTKLSPTREYKTLSKKKVKTGD